ncbi:MAG: hypothetical protein S0880_16140 [Actinomycetota bacterium]|nr:hypothetical protein [Actinomycetota bacterium]
MGTNEPGGSASGSGGGDRDRAVEVELLGAAEVAAAPVATTGGTGGGRRLGPLIVVGALLVALVGWIAFDAVLSDGEASEETATPTTPTSVEPGPTTTPTEPPTTATVAEAPAAPFPALRLLPDAPELASRVAVTATVTADSGDTFSPGDTGPLWLVEGGRAITLEVPGPTGFPAVVVDGDVVMNDGEALTIIDGATGSITAVELDAIVPGSQVAGLRRGATAETMWLVTTASPSEGGLVTFDEATQFSAQRLTFGDDDSVTAEAVLTFTGLPYPVPVGDGLVRATGGGVLYWTDTYGEVPLTALGDGSWLPALAWGDVAVFGDEQGDAVRVVDVRTDTLLAEHPTDADGWENLLGLCVDRGGHRLALRHAVAEVDWSSGGYPLAATFVTLVDLASPSEPRVVELGEPVTGLVWTSADQLVAATPAHLLAVDVATGESRPIAEVAGADLWHVSASGAVC